MLLRANIAHPTVMCACTNTKIRSKPFYTQILSYDTFEMQKKLQS